MAAGGARSESRRGLALIVYSVAVEARQVWEPVAFAAVTVLLLFLVLLFRSAAKGAAVTTREHPVARDRTGSPGGPFEGKLGP